MIEIKDEKWSGIDYLPPHIEVSNMGRVRIFKTRTECEEMRYSKSGNSLLVSIQGKQYAVHRLVADAFVSKEGHEEYKIVEHKNGDKFDNRAENLVWRKYNSGLSETYKKASVYRDWVYCEKLGLIFGTLRSASYYTMMPQEFISYSLANHEDVLGLSFERISPEDAKTLNCPVIYTSFEDAIKEAVKSPDRMKFQDWMKDQIQK